MCCFGCCICCIGVCCGGFDTLGSYESGDGINNKSCIKGSTTIGKGTVVEDGDGDGDGCTGLLRLK